DRGERDLRRLEDLVHCLASCFLSCLLSIFTESPSAMLRTELYGPVTTCSPGFSPASSSKYLSPAMPILIGTNSTALSLSRNTNTPSVSFRVCPGCSSLVAEDAELESLLLRRRRLASFGSLTTWP